MLFCNLPFLLTEWVLAQSFPFLLIQKPYKHKLPFTAASKNADARLINEGHHYLAFFFSLLGNQGEIAVITLHKYNIAEPLELIGKFQNDASFVGKSEHF